MHNLAFLPWNNILQLHISKKRSSCINILYWTWMHIWLASMAHSMFLSKKSSLFSFSSSKTSYCRTRKMTSEQNWVPCIFRWSGFCILYDRIEYAWLNCVSASFFVYFLTLVPPPLVHRILECQPYLYFATVCFSQIKLTKQVWSIIKIRICGSFFLRKQVHVVSSTFVICSY